MRTRICGFLSYNNSEICVLPLESPWKEAKKGRRAGSENRRKGRNEAAQVLGPSMSFEGKNTNVSQKSESEVSQLCLTLQPHGL